MLSLLLLLAIDFAHDTCLHEYFALFWLPYYVAMCAEICKWIKFWGITSLKEEWKEYNK
jgi:hypothetical protein